MALYALVPAAGRGERFGRAKLLVRWRDRELLGHVLSTLAAARLAGLIDRTFVVHRPEDRAIADLAAEYLAWPIETQGDGDLSDSLRTGVTEIRSLDSGRNRSGILICLGDQPLLRLDVIRSLAMEWKGGLPAIRPSYRADPGAPGHPLLLDQRLWPLAAELSGESGFGPLLASHQVPVHLIAVGGENPDIDTPADLARLETAAASG